LNIIKGIDGINRIKRELKIMNIFLIPLILFKDGVIFYFVT